MNPTDRTPKNDGPMSFPPPTEEVWAAAAATVVRQEASPSRIGTQKHVVKNRVPYKQEVWMTIGQFRDIAIDQM